MRRDKGPRCEYEGTKEHAGNKMELRTALHDRVNIECLVDLNRKQN